MADELGSVRQQFLRELTAAVEQRNWDAVLELFRAADASTKELSGDFLLEAPGGRRRDGEPPTGGQSQVFELSTMSSDSCFVSSFEFLMRNVSVYSVTFGPPVQPPPSCKV